jgi:hypothetical protein
MARGRYRIVDGARPHFLTCTAVGWLPVFTRPAAVEIVLGSWRFLQGQGRIVLYGYVVLENHLHWIAGAEDLAKEVGDFKSFTARRIIDHLRAVGDKLLLGQLAAAKDWHKHDRPFQLWQEGSHPQAIQGDAMMLQKLEYIHNNPVKRGYVEDPTHWRYSSARNYARLPGLIDVTMEW